YISAAGMQWAGKNALAELQEHYPKLHKVQTESECGDGSRDWKAAEYTFSLMRHYFNHGTNLYLYWNMVLDDSGNSTWGWKQNALVSVNKTTGEVTYTPEFHLFRHFAQFIPKDSVKLAGDGNFDSALAFLTPSGELVVFAANTHDAEQPVSFLVGDRAFEAKLPARSFHTFRIPGGAKTQAN
ncbi:MAG: glycoside hydrolase family 30 protein, partial [Verrucomicrobiae bacterium]|nr:glycoside hydrolase family 30 protein [Verrucomicrobiae bacterium]